MKTCSAGVVLIHACDVIAYDAAVKRSTQILLECLVAGIFLLLVAPHVPPFADSLGGGPKAREQMGLYAAENQLASAKAATSSLGELADTLDPGALVQARRSAAKRKPALVSIPSAACRWHPGPPPTILETSAATILQFLAGLRGRLVVTFEEGTCAGWLYEIVA